jgi:hypothetical protein
MLVVAPLSEDTQREVHTESDEISNEVMLDVLKAVNAQVNKVDRAHDVPYGEAIARTVRRSTSIVTMPISRGLRSLARTFRLPTQSPG